MNATSKAMASPSAKYQPCHGDDTAAGPSPDGNSKGTSQIALTMKNGGTNDGHSHSGSIQNQVQNGAAQEGAGGQGVAAATAAAGSCWGECREWCLEHLDRYVPCGVPCMPARRRVRAPGLLVCLMCTLCAVCWPRVSVRKALCAWLRVAARGRAWPCVAVRGETVSSGLFVSVHSHPLVLN